MDNNNSSISRVIKTSAALLPSQPHPLPTLHTQHTNNFKQHNPSPQNLNLNNYNPHPSFFPNKTTRFVQHTPLTASQLELDHSPNKNGIQSPPIHHVHMHQKQLQPQPHNVSSHVQDEFMRSTPFSLPQASLPFSAYPNLLSSSHNPPPLPANHSIAPQIITPNAITLNNSNNNHTPLFSSPTQTNATLENLIPTIMEIIQKKITPNSPQNPVITLDGKTTPYNFDKKIQNMKKAIQKYSSQLHNAAANQDPEGYIDLFEKFSKETNTNSLEQSGKPPTNVITSKTHINDKSTNDDTFNSRTLQVYVTHNSIPHDILKETAIEILELIKDQYKTDLDQNTKFSLQNFERQSADLKQILDLNEKKLAEIKSYYEQKIIELEKSEQTKSDELRNDLMKENELLKQKINLLEQKISESLQTTSRENESETSMFSSQSIPYDELIEKLNAMEDELEKSRKREEILLKNKSKTEKEHSKKLQELEGLNLALRNLIKKAP